MLLKLRKSDRLLGEKKAIALLIPPEGKKAIAPQTPLVLEERSANFTNFSSSETKGDRWG